MTNHIEALRLLGSVSRHYRPRDLCGPSNAAIRAALLSKVQGRKVPKSKAGVNALWEAFKAIAPSELELDGECLAAQQNLFTEWAKSQVGDDIPHDGPPWVVRVANTST